MSPCLWLRSQRIQDSQKNRSEHSERSERRALHAREGRIDLAKRIESLGISGGHANGYVPEMSWELFIRFYLHFTLLITLHYYEIVGYVLAITGHGVVAMFA
jgi:hypothetical protein